MKFYDRKIEIELLNRNLLQSTKSACFTVLIGRRRIGKTALLAEAFKNQKYLYLFVSRKKEVLLCAQYQIEVEKALGLRIFGNVTHFRDLFEQLLLFAKKESLTLIIDEFQEFERVNPAIFSDMQYLWDLHHSESKINLIVCGSIYSLMMKIFEDKKEPLFGRLTSKIVLKPFPVSVMKEILRDFNPNYVPEDLLGLYTLTGGVAKYITLLMEAGATTLDKMLDFVTRPDSPFLGEGRDLLVSEFGKEYGTYFSILQLIASGKTVQAEIDSIIGKNTGAYLENLDKEYSLISRNKPLFSKPGSRKARWALNDNYLQFWFRFIYPNQSMIELGKNELLKAFISQNYLSYSGITLEKYFREKLAEGERVTEVGKYWDNKGQNEIDVIALNTLDKTIVIAEVKRNFKKIDLALLEKKSQAIRKELSSYQIEYCGLSLKDM